MRRYQRVKNIGNYNKCCLRISFSFIICLGILLFSWAVLSLTYKTNDDAAIQWAVSGFGTGKPYPFHQYINCILGYGVCALYRILPNFQWWHVVSIGCMLIGIFVIYYNLMKCFELNAIGVGWRIATIALSAITVWPYFISRSSFTVVPAILAIGIITILLSSKQFHIVRVWLPMLACLIANLFREQTGLVVSCYLFLCLFFYWMNINNKTKKITEVMIMSMILYIILLYVSNAYSIQQYQHVNSKEFLEYNSARVQYTDYPHISYIADEDVYHSVEWDWELTSLVNQWCFLDERVDADAFNTICSVYGDGGMGNAINVWLCLIDTNQVAFFITIIGFVQSIILVYFFYRMNIQNKILSIGNICGSVLLIAYLCRKGRLPLRAYAVVLIPMMVINSFVIISLNDIKEQKNNRVVKGLTVFIVLLASLNLINSVYINSDKDQIIGRREQSVAISEYLINHNDNVYISSLLDYWSNDTNMVYKNEKPSNWIFWGGSTWLSDSYYKNLEMLGVDGKLTMRSFAEDNIYFMTPYIDTYNGETIEYTVLNDFFANLTDYGAILIEKVDDIGNYASVWKFIFDNSLIDYSGECYLDGVGFYYTDGRREHGKVQIDEKMYDLTESGTLLRINESQYMSIYGAIEESLPEL